MMTIKISRLMCDISMRDYRKMLSVNRLSGCPISRNYNLVEHCYFTSIIFQKFCEIQAVEYTMDELNLVLVHDLFEIKTGDLPYTVKNLNSSTKESWKMIENCVAEQNERMNFVTDQEMKKRFSEKALAIFKISDLWELWNFLHGELRIGNRNPEIEEIMKRCEKIIFSIIEKNEFKALKREIELEIL